MQYFISNIINQNYPFMIKLRIFTLNTSYHQFFAFVNIIFQYSFDYP